MTDNPHQPPDEPGQPFRPATPPPNQPTPNQPPPNHPPPNQPPPGQPAPGQPFQPGSPPPNQPGPGQPAPGQPFQPGSPEPNQPPGRPAPGLPFQPPAEQGVQPFQPTRSSGPQGGPGVPPSSGESTSAAAFLGVMVGLVAGLGLPPLLFGIFLALIGDSDGPALVLLPILLAVVVPVAAFIATIKALDKDVPKQAATRTALVVTGWISLAFWALILIIFGLCLALLAGAY